MDVKVQVSGEKATLSLSGRFDFTAHKEFRQHAERTVQNNGITGVEVDKWQQTDGMNSGDLLNAAEALKRAEAWIAAQ